MINETHKLGFLKAAADMGVDPSQMQAPQGQGQDPLEEVSQLISQLPLQEQEALLQQISQMLAQEQAAAQGGDPSQGQPKMAGFYQVTKPTVVQGILESCMEKGASLKEAAIFYAENAATIATSIDLKAKIAAEYSEFSKQASAYGLNEDDTQKAFDKYLQSL